MREGGKGGGRERERVKRRDDDYLATERTTTTMTSMTRRTRRTSPTNDLDLLTRHLTRGVWGGGKGMLKASVGERGTHRQRTIAIACFVVGASEVGGVALMFEKIRSGRSEASAPRMHAGELPNEGGSSWTRMRRVALD